MRDLTDRLFGPEAPSVPRETWWVWRREREALRREYVAALPAVPVSRCPVCHGVTRKAMDLEGLDGPWWSRRCPDPAPEACAHWLVYLGALDLHGRAPAEADRPWIDRILLGPEVPYVVPRLLGEPGMRCVISSVSLQTGDTAYLMNYYAEPPAAPGAGHQAWLRETYSWGAAPGGYGQWSSRRDRWDFDLRPWLARTPPLLYWIAPGDASLALRVGPGCPYLDLPGRRVFLTIANGSVHESAPPDGEALDEAVFGS